MGLYVVMHTEKRVRVHIPVFCGVFTTIEKALDYVNELMELKGIPSESFFVYDSSKTDEKLYERVPFGILMNE